MASNDNNPPNWPKIGAYGAVSGIAAAQAWAINRAPGGKGYFNSPLGFLKPSSYRLPWQVLAASAVGVAGFAAVKHFTGGGPELRKVLDEQTAKRKNK